MQGHNLCGERSGEFLPLLLLLAGPLDMARPRLETKMIHEWKIAQEKLQASDAFHESQITIHKLQKRKAGGRACRVIGLEAAAGCNPCLSIALHHQEEGKCMLLFAAGNSGHSGKIVTPRPGS